MEYILFVVQLLFLLFISRFITRNLFSSFYHNTRNIKTSTFAIAVIYFPGVVVHELSHVVSAVILGVRVGGIEFWPSFTEGNLKLGSVQIAKTDPIRRTIIGIAPVFGGIMVILASLWALGSILPKTIIWYLIVGIFVYQVASTMFSSKKDLEGTRVVFAAIIFLFALLWYLGFPFLSILFDSGIGEYITNVFAGANYFLMLAVGINFSIAAAIYLLQNIRKKKSTSSSF